MSAGTADPIRITRDDPRYPPALRRFLGSGAPEVITVRGTPELLRIPPLALFCSIRVPGSVILRTYDLTRALRDAGVPVIAGFQSPMERECLELLLRGRQPVVICPARGIDTMRFPAPWRILLKEGRLLVISRFGPKHRRPTTILAEKRNTMVAALADRVFVAYAAPGGRTFALARRVLGWGKPVFTFDDEHNTDLLLAGAQPVQTASDLLGGVPPRAAPEIF